MHARGFASGTDARDDRRAEGGGKADARVESFDHVVSEVRSNAREVRAGPRAAVRALGSERDKEISARGESSAGAGAGGVTAARGVVVADVQVAPESFAEETNEVGRGGRGGGLRVGVEFRAALGAPLVHGALDGVSQRVGQQARAHGAGLEAADELRHVQERLHSRRDVAGRGATSGEGRARRGGRERAGRATRRRRKRREAETGRGHRAVGLCRRGERRSGETVMKQHVYFSEGADDARSAVDTSRSARKVRAMQAGETVTRERGDETARVWCHDCRARFSVPPAAVEAREPACPSCRGTFVELLDEPPVASASGASNVHVRLGEDAGPDDLARAARHIMQQMSAGYGAPRELDPARGDGQIHVLVDTVAIPSQGAFARVPWAGLAADPFPDINIAELDTRTFYQPADPELVAALPTVPTPEFAEGEDRACPVCLVDMDPGEPSRELPCGHRFHGECILEWLRTKNSCPVCRTVLGSVGGSGAT